MKELSKIGIFALLLTSSLTIMVGTVIAPSLNEIAEHLGFTNSPGWLITLPSLGVVLFAPLMGNLIDKKGPYRVLCFGLIPYAFLGVVGAYIDNYYLVIADRILLGAATAALQAAGSSLIAEFFSGNNRMKMMAWQGMAIEIGGVVFLSVGGILGEMGWQYPFYIYLIALLCAALVVLYIPRPQKDSAKILAGEIDTHDDAKNKRVISPAILTICLSVLFAMIFFFIAFVGLPQYLPKNFNYSESQTGYFMAFISLIAVLFASRLPQLSKLLKPYSIVALGFVLFALGLFLFAVAEGNGVLVCAAIAIGAGFGFTVPLLNHMTVEHSNNSNRGKNLSYYSIGVFGGQFLSSFVGLVFSDMMDCFTLAAILALMIAVLLFGKEIYFKAGAAS